MAKDTYTLVTLPDTNERLERPYAYKCWGRLTREEAIKEVRALAEKDLRRAQEFLNTPDDQLYVRVEKGTYRVEVVEVLEPPTGA